MFLPGTIFIPTTINSEAQLHTFIVTNYSPPIVQPSVLETATDRLLNLYPDIAALGSPFGTGNNTFGLSSQYKRASALRTTSYIACLALLNSSDLQRATWDLHRNDDSGSKQLQKQV